MRQFERNNWYYVGELKGETYHKFLKFSLSYSDYFSVSTFKSVREKDLKDSYREFLKEVSLHEIDAYCFKQLPQHYERGQKIHVYSLNESTRKAILNASVEGIYSWIIPFLPEDLSFFKGKKVWFNSISHAKISKMCNVDDNVLKVVSQMISVTEGR